MQTAERLARALKMACEGYDVVIIASSDLVHYMPKAMADRLDSHFLNAVASGNVASVYDEVRRNNLSVCGYGPIATAMLMSLPGRIQVMDQTDSSFALNHDTSAVVGYGSVVMRRN